MYTNGVTACDRAGNNYFSVIFFSLISLMFDGFAEETLTVRPPLLPDTSFRQWRSACSPGLLTTPHKHSPRRARV